MATPAWTLNDGALLPSIGFGTFPLRGNEGYVAFRAAFDNGYRLLDSAAHYRNEVEVGRAARDFMFQSGVSRDEIVIQTKIPGHLHDYEPARQACQDSLELLGLDRIDVLLVHSPNAMTGAFREAWRAAIDLRESGIVRSIGVSNFTAQNLADVIADSGVTPVINQVELHPYAPMDDLRAEHARLGVVTEAWSPFGTASRASSEPVVAQVATAHGVTPDQVVLRWHMQSGVVPLPVATAATQQRANIDLFGFELSTEEIAAISSLARPDLGPAPGESSALSGW